MKADFSSFFLTIIHENHSTFQESIGVFSWCIDWTLYTGDIFHFKTQLIQVIVIRFIFWKRFPKKTYSNPYFVFFFLKRVFHYVALCKTLKGLSYYWNYLSKILKAIRERHIFLGKHFIYVCSGPLLVFFIICSSFPSPSTPLQHFPTPSSWIDMVMCPFFKIFVWAVNLLKFKPL